jgi:hypothetical protein
VSAFNDIPSLKAAIAAGIANSGVDEAEAINVAAGTYDDVDEVLDAPDEQLYAILLDVQTDWPEVVFVGTFDQCEDHRNKVVTPIVEANGDEAVYYETVAIVDTARSIQALRERQAEEDREPHDNSFYNR